MKNKVIGYNGVEYEVDDHTLVYFGFKNNQKLTELETLSLTAFLLNERRSLNSTDSQR